MSLGSIVSGIGNFIHNVSGVASAFIGKKAQDNTNEMNYRIAQEQNELNERMFHEANAFTHQERLEAQQFNRDMFNQSLAEHRTDVANERAYSSPAAEAQRLRAAGLNPALVMSGDSSTGAMQSSPSAPSSSGGSSVGWSGAAGATMQNYNFGGALLDGLSQMANLDSLREDIKGKRIDNQTRAQKNISDIDNVIANKQRLLADKDVSEANKKLILSDIDRLNIQKRTMQLDYDRQFRASFHDEELFSLQKQAFQDAHNLSLEQSKSLMLANSIEEKFGMKFKESQLNQFIQSIQKMKAEVGLLLAQKNLTGAQKDKIIEEKAKLFAERCGIALDNNFKRDTMLFEFERVCRELDLSDWSVKQASLDYYNPFNYVGKALGGSFRIR